MDFADPKSSIELQPALCYAVQLRSYTLVAHQLKCIKPTARGDKELEDASWCPEPC